MTKEEVEVNYKTLKEILEETPLEKWERKDESSYRLSLGGDYTMEISKNGQYYMMRGDDCIDASGVEGMMCGSECYFNHLYSSIEKCWREKEEIGKERRIKEKQEEDLGKNNPKIRALNKFLDKRRAEK